MSRISAFTTFRLIGSPTNPGMPYRRPWSACAAMLSLVGDIPDDLGVGDGEAVQQESDNTRASAHANDRKFSGRLRHYFSPQEFTEYPPRATLEMPSNEHLKRAPHLADLQVFSYKKQRTNN